MRNRILLIGAIIVSGFLACNNAQKENVTITPKTEKMNNLISIIEIPTTDFSRAITFYQKILNVTIEVMEMDGVNLGVIPSEEGTVSVVLAKGADYKPTTEGAVLYLNAGKDLLPILDKVEKNGGKVIVAKTIISPEMGYFAMFIDTEGNKLGLHSIN